LNSGTLTDVARSDNTASHIGTGIPTVTSFDGAAGTGILWFTTRDGDLNAYRAIPVSKLTLHLSAIITPTEAECEIDGVLQRINLPTGIKSAKFQRPAFGNGRVYVSTSNGHIACFGKKP
jgi:iron transport multicopper oxidase